MSGERMNREQTNQFYYDLAMEDYLRARAGKPFMRGNWVIAFHGENSVEEFQVIEIEGDGKLKLRGDKAKIITVEPTDVFHIADFEAAQKQFSHGWNN